MIIKPGEYSDAELYYMLCSDRKTAEAAFGELYRLHSPRIFAYCRRFLGSTAEAQDAFQETFVKFYQSAKPDRVMTNVPAFLLRIARNLCVNLKRTDKQDISFEEWMIGSEEMNSDKEELLALIKAALDKLPQEYREVFMLREYEGLTYAEIAEVTGEALSTVKIRIYRAKQKIREKLQPYLTEFSKQI